MKEERAFAGGFSFDIARVHSAAGTVSGFTPHVFS